MVVESNHRPTRPEQGGAPFLGSFWPSFLDDLNSDPDAAFRGFYRYVKRMMRICPPSIFYSLDALGQEDLVHDLILHCCRENFRVLRRYANHGKPFAAWLQLVARNKVIDEIRRRSQSAAVPLTTNDDDRPDIDPADPTPGADRVTDRKKILGLVQTALDSLSNTCRLLIQGAAEGFKPRELVRLLGWPADRNKKVSDDLRECRKRLRKTLVRNGLAEGEMQRMFGD